MGEYKLNIVADTTNFHSEIERCQKELLKLEELAKNLNHIQVKLRKWNALQRFVAKIFRLY